MQDLFGQLEIAIHDTVSEFRCPRTRSRGAVGLAPHLGMQPGTLSNKANPSMETHKLALTEAVPLQLAANDFRILHAFAADLGHCAWPLPDASQASDMAVLDAYAEVHARAGEKCRAIRDALADNRITRAELQEIRALFDQEVRAGLELIARLEALGS